MMLERSYWKTSIGAENDTTILSIDEMVTKWGRHQAPLISFSAWKLSMFLWTLLPPILTITLVSYLQSCLRIPLVLAHEAHCLGSV
jgi:hypothetical protein